MLYMQKEFAVLLHLPLDPRITWMLSPALIRAWTSVVLLAPGITISVDRRKSRHNPFIVYLSSWVNSFKILYSGFVWCFERFEHFKIWHITSCGDDPLHINSSFLQEVDRQAASRAGASHAHADLARHHGDWGWLDGPDTCYRLVIRSCHGTPENEGWTHETYHISNSFVSCGTKVLSLEVIFGGEKFKLYTISGRHWWLVYGFRCWDKLAINTFTVKKQNSTKHRYLLPTIQPIKWDTPKQGKLKHAVWNSPATLGKRWYVCEGKITGWIIGGVRWARIGHRRSFLILIAFLGSSLLCFGQFRLLAVHQKRLVMERWLMWQVERWKLKVSLWETDWSLTCHSKLTICIGFTILIK